MKQSDRPLYPLYEEEGKEDDTGDPDKPTSRDWLPAETPALNYNPGHHREPVLRKMQSQQGQTTHLYVGQPTVGTARLTPLQARVLRSSVMGSNTAREKWGQPLDIECKKPEVCNAKLA